ncbi:MBOAT, membrane-bound O-acyltransferase family-domain-containing protein [Gymnopilus junonius]|uniref:MBOAT, membrane-bound O-acyltransferase family-domain-containing protein n=1 Tax=Gymnopilus junonius TaxID=109634 RepID=A0A9P5N9G3_GYMJU|nr:MBOAT, membrane-bound O-acyltransferase family-domain-containing protein [Gymnopilus junonius]
MFFFFPVLRLYSAFFQLLASILTTYFVTKYDKSKRMPWVVFVHVIRVIYGFSYETIEVTGPQMVLTMKLTTFAWNVYDGRRKAEDLDKWQMAKRIVEYPSLLEFLGYSFYFPGILVGPYLDYSEYTDLINETMMVLGLLYLGAFVVFGGKWNYSVSLQDWFVHMPLWKRIGLYQLVGPIERAKYYAIWTLTEGASILTGLGFTGITPSGQPLWDGAANVKVLTIEFPENFKVLLDSWNMKTNIWLRECVYKRVTPKGKKPGNMSSMITFFTSAFWHGIASGYYLTFLMGGFITAAARQARSNIRPLLLPPPSNHHIPPSLLKRLYDVSGTILSLGWYGHVIVMGGLVFFYAGGAKWCKALQKKKGILPSTKSKDAAKAGANGKASNGTSTPASAEEFVLPPPVDTIVPPLEK